MFSVEDKVVVITGAAGVLGGSIARHFAEQYATVVVLDINSDKLRERGEELKRISPNVAGYVCNVLSETELNDVSKRIVERFDRIDILINVAGGNTAGATVSDDESFFDIDLSEWEKAVNFNINGSVYPSITFGRIMARQGVGSIINISSMAAYCALTRVPAYSAAKTAISNFTQWLATEVALKFGDKIRVNAIAPGFFIGDQNRAMLINEDGSLTERSQKILAKTPMHRFGDITELNGAIQFLCSDEASFVTGAVLPIDGGFSAFSGV